MFQWLVFSRWDDLWQEKDSRKVDSLLLTESERTKKKDRNKPPCFVFNWQRWDSNPRLLRLVPKTSALDHSATLPVLLTGWCSSYRGSSTTCGNRWKGADRTWKASGGRQKKCRERSESVALRSLHTEYSDVDQWITTTRNAWILRIHRTEATASDQYPASAARRFSSTDLSWRCSGFISMCLSSGNVWCSAMERLIPLYCLKSIRLFPCGMMISNISMLNIRWNKPISCFHWSMNCTEWFIRYLRTLLNCNRCLFTRRFVSGRSLSLPIFLSRSCF